MMCKEGGERFLFLFAVWVGGTAGGGEGETLASLAAGVVCREGRGLLKVSGSIVLRVLHRSMRDLLMLSTSSRTRAGELRRLWRIWSVEAVVRGAILPLPKAPNVLAIIERCTAEGLGERVVSAFSV